MSNCSSGRTKSNDETNANRLYQNACACSKKHEAVKVSVFVSYLSLCLISINCLGHPMNHNVFKFSISNEAFHCS